MTTLRTAAQQALEALELAQTDVHWELNSPTRKFLRKAEKTLRAALAQEQAEPVAEIIESKIKGDSHQTLDEAMQQPRAMAQAYESGYKAGVANEREACAKVCESRFMGDLTREDMEARRCAAAIRARGGMP